MIINLELQIKLYGQSVTLLGIHPLWEIKSFNKVQLIQSYISSTIQPIVPIWSKLHGLFLICAEEILFLITKKYIKLSLFYARLFHSTYWTNKISQIVFGQSPIRLKVPKTEQISFFKVRQSNKWLIIRKIIFCR